MPEEPITVTAELRDAEQEIERRSAVFKKELGLTDLALTQILFIVGLPWVGIAGKLGPSHVIYWLLAMGLFNLRWRAGLSFRIRLFPLEGGLMNGASSGSNGCWGLMSGGIWCRF